MEDVDGAAAYWQCCSAVTTIKVDCTRSDCLSAGLLKVAAAAASAVALTNGHWLDPSTHCMINYSLIVLQLHPTFAAADGKLYVCVFPMRAQCGGFTQVGALLCMSEDCKGMQVLSLKCPLVNHCNSF